MSKLEQLIAQREGFGVAGDLPTRSNNPGDLRHAPGEMHDPANPNSVGSFASVSQGWAALERQLGLYASRGLTLEQMICGVPDAQGQLQGGYAPDSDGNDSNAYLDFLCQGLDCMPDTLVSDALKIT